MLRYPAGSGGPDLQPSPRSASSASEMAAAWSPNVWAVTLLSTGFFFLFMALLWWFFKCFCMLFC